MNSIIDIFNNLLIYNNNEINILLDTDNNIWFKFISIAKILNYKSIKDTIRDNIENKNKKRLKEINLIFKIKNNDHPNTIYINENGLYNFLIKSRMKKAKEFQLWLINDVLPNLRKFGKYEVNKKLKLKLKTLNKKIKLLEKQNETLKKNMIKNKYPKGMYIYILEDDKLYKIGYTNDLQKRINNYNIGKANKADYKYYRKTNCGKEIEKCMKSILNKYIYKSNKEFYDCKLEKIINAIAKCLNIENKCAKCNKIITQTGGQSITKTLIDKYKNKYNDINILIYNLSKNE
jgi:prophage antirepressor-like protein